MKAQIEDLGYEGEIDTQGIAESLIANVAQKLNDKEKMEEAKTISMDDFIPHVQNLLRIHIIIEATNILIESAEYIISNA